MTLLPVVERELRVAGRRRGTYGSRLVAAVAGCVVAAWILVGASYGAVQIGAIVFRLLAELVFVYAALAGLLSTCDCLSEEKREGTLGLLFLTDLKGYDVVFGKLVSTSVKTFYGVLAVAPVLAVSVVLGAVTGGEVVRAVLVSVNLLFFFLSAGLLASALCRQDNRALGLAVLLSAGWLVTIPALARMPALHIAHPDVGFIFSPAFGCFSAFEDMYHRFSRAWFWLNGLVTQIYAWSMLGLACWIVPRSWQDSSAGRELRRRSLVKMKKVRGSEERKEVLAVNVFLWRAAQPGLHRTVVWLALLAVALLWLAADSLLPVARFDVTKNILALLLGGAVVKVWLASEASATLSADRRNAAMELLLTTPLPEAEILKGQRLALWRQFAEPGAALFLANMFLLIMEILQLPPGSPPDDSDLLIGMHVIVAGSFVVDLMALSWVAMWLGLIQRKPNRAAALALLEILLIPYLLCLAMAGGVPNPASLLIFSNIVGAGSAFFFAQRSHTRLGQWFRKVVAEGVKPKLRGEAATDATPVLEGAE
jgi:ABC-type transport system involved in cytochrome c biogenesis permease component